MLHPTWRPTRIRLVSAPSGKTACTCGTTVLLSTPPSGPMRLLSCLIRDTTAKYWGKSRVMMRQMRFFSSSSGVSSTEGREGMVRRPGFHRNLQNALKIFAVLYNLHKVFCLETTEKETHPPVWLNQSNQERTDIQTEPQTEGCKHWQYLQDQQPNKQRDWFQPLLPIYKVLWNKTSKQYQNMSSVLMLWVVLFTLGFVRFFEKKKKN